MGNLLSAELLASREAQSGLRLSLVFRPGKRPAADDVARRAQLRRADLPGFAVSHRRELADELELLIGGMIFDLSGLAPAEAAPPPPVAHCYGCTEAAALGEAVVLAPGDSLRGSENLLPVVRMMAGLAAGLAELADATAVVWHPARCAMAPASFIALISSWLKGGPFPALGLTALICDDHGGIYSEGLTFFIGQELWIDPDIGKNTIGNTKIATRLINHLVGIGPLHQPFETVGPSGEHLSVVPPGKDGLIRVWRKT